MQLLEKAIMIATMAHDRQVDKCGEPYILHPIRVMLSMQTVNDRCVAVLHDVLEDTEVTVDDLMNEFPSEIVDAVIAITKIKDEKYDDYLNKVAFNESAKRVKIADIKDNSSPIRLYKLQPSNVAYLSKKYSKALQFLEK